MSSIGTRGEMVMSGLLKPLAGNGIILLDNRRRKVCAANEPFIIEIMLAAHHMMGGSFLGYVCFKRALFFEIILA